MIKPISIIFTLVAFHTTTLLAQESPALRPPDMIPSSARQENPNIVLGSVTMIKKTVSVFDHYHIGFDQVLKKYVKEIGKTSRVDYKTLKKNAPELITYLNELENVTTADFKNWSQKQKFSFWVNAYNAYTLKLIIDNYPVKSIKDIGGRLSTPWRKKFIPLLGKIFSLDNIEHDILRPKFKEPRVHFVLNCASISCPPLRPEAYSVDKLENQLNEQTRLFINDPANNQISFSRSRINLKVSKIFDWFKSDFAASGGTAAFIINHLDLSPEQKNKALTLRSRVTYFPYDWGLNEIK